MNIIDTIIQGGGVGMAVFAMYIVWKLSSNHINHNTEALTELKDVIRELSEVLKKK